MQSIREYVSIKSVLVFAALCAVLYVAVYTVPFNWDSMTYHLARVQNWMQNRSVSYYVTNCPRQLYSPVFAEYIVLHFQLLTRWEPVVNFVQAFSYVLCVLLVDEIMEHFNVSRCGRVLAVLLFASMPMAIAQSITTQTDLVGTVWLLVFVRSVMELIDTDKLQCSSQALLNVILCATAIGMGYLTKSIVCIGMLPFLIWLLIRCIIRRDALLEVVKCACIGGAVVLGFALPTWVRNYAYTGSVLASEYFGRLTIGTLNPRYVLGNIYKNWMILTATENTKDMLANGGRYLEEILGIDINDPLIAAYPGDFSGMKTTLHSDHASCFVPSWIFVVFFVAFIIVLIFKKMEKRTSSFLICIFFAVLSGLIALRFQPWGARLLLPYATLMCLFVGMFWEYLLRHIFPKRALQIVITSICGAVLLTCMIAPIDYSLHYKRGLEGNDDRFVMYFDDRGEYKQYKQICDLVKESGFARIGLYLNGDSYEYPLWAALKDGNTNLIQVVPEESYTPIAVPECIIAIHQSGCGEELAFFGNAYHKKYDYDGTGEYCLFLKNN